MRDVMEKGGVDSLATRGPPKTPAVSFVHNSNSLHWCPYSGTKNGTLGAQTKISRPLLYAQQSTFPETDGVVFCWRYDHTVISGSQVRPKQEQRHCSDKLGGARSTRGSSPKRLLKVIIQRILSTNSYIVPSMQKFLQTQSSQSSGGSTFKYKIPLSKSVTDNFSKASCSPKLYIFSTVLNILCQ